MMCRLLLFFFVIVSIASCTSAKQLSQKDVDIAKYSSQLPDSLSLKQAAGIDFTASGSNPVSWSLDMNIGKKYSFNATDGINISTMAIGATTSTNEANTYTCNTANGPMKIIVYNQTCTGTNDAKTEIYLNAKQYSGCGKNLYDYRLNDIWVLQSAGDEVLKAADFPKGLPQIVFNLAQKTLTGTDGCNNITVPIIVLGNSIQFGNIASTKMACKNPLAQNIFTEKLSNKSANYYFKDSKLYLYLIDDSMLTFIKAN